MRKKLLLIMLVLISQNIWAKFGGGSGISLATEDMKTQDSFTSSVGWDFLTTPIWKIDSNNDGYPYSTRQTFEAAEPEANCALSFNGTSDYVDLGNAPYSGDFTIEAWIKTTSSAIEKNIAGWGHFSNNDNVQFRVQSGQLQFGMDVGGWRSVISSAFVNTGEWTHVAVVKNGTNVQLYVNGTADGAGFFGGLPFPTVNKMLIGVHYKNGANNPATYFDGQIDEVRFWNTVRTQEEIQQNAGIELTGDETGLSYYYKMSDGSGSTLSCNQASGTYDGTITGAEWVTPGVLLNVPATQVSNINFSALDETSMTIAWTKGDGSKRIVFLKQGSSGTASPEVNTSYSANTTFGSGTEIGTTGWFCVYNGTGTSVNVSNLNSSTDYIAQVFEYNGIPLGEKYLTSTSVNNPNVQTTALPVELTSFTAKVIQDKVVLNWSTETEVNNFGFEIQRLEVRIRKPDEQKSDWVVIGFVPGHGSSSSFKEYSFADANPPAEELLYRLKQIDNDGKYKYYNELSIAVNAPSEFKLLQNSPNPFNPSTAIKFQLPLDSKVTIKVYNMLGSEVATLVNEVKPAGSHIVYWNGRDKNNQIVSSGVYLYELAAGSYTETKKMNLLK